MDWVNLLQDGAIVCLAVALIVDSFSIRSLRKQVDGLRKSKQDKGKESVKNLALIDEYDQGNEVVPRLYNNGHFVIPVCAPRHLEECKSAPGLNPRLFRKGDSVRLRGLHGEFNLTGYSSTGFSAKKRTSSFDMKDGSSVDVSTTVTFHADRVTAWKRNTGEWPVDWFMGTGNKREEGGSDDHGRRVKEPDKKNAAGSSCGVTKESWLLSNVN